MPKTTKRPRGAQPGNLNALKHGFYTRRIHQRDLAGLEATDFKGLRDEIAVIRVYTRRLLELGNQSENLVEVAGVLRILCLASLTINRLIKTHQFLVGGTDEVASEIHEAISRITQKYHLDQYASPSLPPSSPLPPSPPLISGEGPGVRAVQGEGSGVRDDPSP